MSAFRVLLFASLGVLFACLTCGIWTNDERWFMTAGMPAGLFALLLVVAPIFWSDGK